MNSLLSSFGSLTLLLGGAQGAAPDPNAPAPNPFISFLPLIIIVGIFYFLILRPQNKKQKQTQRMLAAIKKGDKVVTIGGIHGIIQSVKDSTVILKVDANVKLEFNRGAIASVESQAKEEEKDEKEEKETKEETPLAIEDNNKQ